MVDYDTQAYIYIILLSLQLEDDTEQSCRDQRNRESRFFLALPFSQLLLLFSATPPFMDAGNIRTTQFLIHNQYCNSVFFVSFRGFFSNSLNIPHTVPSFPILFTSILEFLQLKYQGKQQTPFDTHPLVTYVGIFCLILYCLGYNVEQRFSTNLRYRIRFSKYVCWIMVFSGSVCLASTVSILFPDRIRPILFVMFFVIAAAELLHFLYCSIVQRIAEFSRRRRRRRRSSVRGGGQILPLYF